MKINKNNGAGKNYDRLLKQIHKLNRKKNKTQIEKNIKDFRDFQKSINGNDDTIKISSADMLKQLNTQQDNEELIQAINDQENKDNKCACCGRKFNKKGNGLYVTFNNLIAVCDEDTHIVDNIGTVCDFCYADLDTATQMLKNIGLTVVKDH